MEPGFLKVAFAQFDENVVLQGFDDRVTLDNLQTFLRYLLKHYSKIRRFFEDKGETFFIEIHFQLPFIHKSILKSEQKKALFAQNKIRFYNTYRQNLRGILLITKDENEAKLLQPKDHILLNIPANSKELNLCLSYPIPLKVYWDKVLDEFKHFF